MAFLELSALGEADGPSGSWLVPSVDLPEKVNSPAADKSSGIYSGRPCDPRAFQRVYPDRWHSFLKAHFRNSVEVAAFFDVNEKTARLWLEGCNAPRGWAVAYAVTRLPSAAKYLLEVAA
jgi:hypothetical protein